MAPFIFDIDGHHIKEKRCDFAAALGVEVQERKIEIL